MLGHAATWSTHPAKPNGMQDSPTFMSDYRQLTLAEQSIARVPSGYTLRQGGVRTRLLGSGRPGERYRRQLALEASSKAGNLSSATAPDEK